MDKIQQWKEQLEIKLSGMLPGFTAQQLMSPVATAGAYREANDSSKKAAVTLLLFPEDGEVKMVLIKRAIHPLDKHSGQISLPGGKLEDDDQSILDCALRELNEELGIKKDQLTILGKLSEIYVFVSDFLVFPYVAWTDTKPTFILQKEEVDRVLTPSIEQVFNDENKKSKDLLIRNMTMKDVPYYDINGEVLWGATAMILSEFGQLY